MPRPSARRHCRPTMRFVPVKSEEVQGAAMVFRVRELLIRQRTRAINALRGHLTEFGQIVPQGASNSPINSRKRKHHECECSPSSPHKKQYGAVPPPPVYLTPQHRRGKPLYIPPEVSEPGSCVDGGGSMLIILRA